MPSRVRPRSRPVHGLGWQPSAGPPPARPSRPPPQVDALVATLLLALPLAVLVAPGACGPAAWLAAAAAVLLLAPLLLDPAL